MSKPPQTVRAPGRQGPAGVCTLGQAAERAILASGRGDWARAAGAEMGATGLYDRLRRAAFGAIIRGMARERGLPEAGGGLPGWDGGGELELPCWPRAADVRELGAAHEHLLELTPGLDAEGGLTLARTRGHARKASGSYYTPAHLVDHILDRALEPALDEAWARGGTQEILRVRVCDPACGTGHFLVPAAARIAQRLVRAGFEKEDALAAAQQCVCGMDLSPLAADLCRACLWLECSRPGRPGAFPSGNIRAGDALTADWRPLFPEAFARGGFDAVVGNPPFLNQLESGTVRSRSDAAAIKRAFPGIVGPYTDPAALFMVLGTRIAREGGRIAMVQPQSVLAARDARGCRDEVLARGVPESLWVAGEHIFEALVLVCAISFRVGGPRAARLARSAGAGFRPLPTLTLDADALKNEDTWAPLAAAAMGIPDAPLRVRGTLADLASATADFRDQFYGLRGFLIEDGALAGRDPAAFPPLVTTGLIDPAACLWGRTPTRFDGRPWNAPRVDLGALEAAGRLGPWARARLVPKILLATQTRVLEAAVDERGTWLPAVPLITIVPRDPADLWRLAAAMLSPPLTIWAAQRYGIGGLSAGSIKLSARQSLGLPMPEAHAPWARAAALVRAAAGADDAGRWPLLLESAALMCEAYGLAPAEAQAATAWWRGLCGRLATWRVGAIPGSVRQPKSLCRQDTIRAL